MFKVAAITLGAAGLMGLVGCNLPNVGTALPLASSQAAQATDSVVKDSGLSGNKAIALNVLAPNESGFRTQAVVHKWVDNDIFEYVATLKAWNGTAYVDFTTPLTVTIPRKGVSPKTKAVFANLRQGAKYQVSLLAKGNIGGTAATSALNSTAPTAVFDFTATQDVEDTLSASMQITFDAVPFSGSGTSTVTAPADGTYANPSAAESGAAQ